MSTALAVVTEVSPEHTVIVGNTLMTCIYGQECDGINHWYRAL